MRLFRSNQNGMTKVELIVSIALGILLIGGNVFLYWFLNNQSRDLMVIADVNRLRSAIQYNLVFNTEYPQHSEPIELNDRDLGTEKLCLEGFAPMVRQCEKTILHKIPNSFASEGNIYTYASAEPTSYFIQFNLLANSSRFGLVAGPNCATNEGLSPGPCFEN